MAKKHVTIRDIAALAGVSPTAVSYAVNGDPQGKLSPARRQQILDLCALHHYSPNVHMRRMFSRHAQTVALFFPPFESSGGVGGLGVDLNFGSCMIGAQHVLAGAGFDLLLNETSSAFVSSHRYLDMVRSSQVDGVLLWGVTECDGYVPSLLGEGVPVVMLQNELAGCECPRVLSDDFHAMYSLTERVIAAGHRRIAVAFPSASASTGALRQHGILSALSAHGLSPCHVASHSGYSLQFGREATVEILSQCPDATCLMMPNDMAAWGCLEELGKRGISVPGDKSVTGADGLAFPSPVRISSYRLPSQEIGRLGAEMLLSLLSGRRVEEVVSLCPESVEGTTLGAV